MNDAVRVDETEAEVVDGEIPIHPLATVYRMHTDEELETLVASIKKNGLRDPIMLAEDGRLIDGRNRLQACGRAGVEPRFETLPGDEDAIRDFIFDKNGTRRDLSEGQKALAYANLYRSKQQGKKRDADLSKFGQVNRQRISDARLILDYSSADEIDAVRDGTTVFYKAHQRAAERRDREAEPIVDEVAELAKKDERLADLVRQGELTVEAATRELEVRKQKLRERRSTALGFFRQSLVTFSGLASDDFATFMAESLTDPLFRAELVKSLEFDRSELDKARASVAPAATNLKAILKAIEDKL